MTQLEQTNRVFDAADFREGMQEEYEFQYTNSKMSVSTAFQLLNEQGWEVHDGDVIDGLKRALADALHSVIMEHMLDAYQVVDFDLLYSDSFLGNPGGYTDEYGVFWVEAESMCHYKIDHKARKFTSGRIKLSASIYNDDAKLNEMLGAIRKHVDDQVKALNL